MIVYCVSYHKAVFRLLDYNCSEVEQRNIIIDNDTVGIFIFAPLFEYDISKPAFYIIYFIKTHYSMWRGLLSIAIVQAIVQSIFQWVIIYIKIFYITI